jgi:hypothetical protein
MESDDFETPETLDEAGPDTDLDGATDPTERARRLRRIAVQVD